MHDALYLAILHVGGLEPWNGRPSMPLPDSESTPEDREWVLLAQRAMKVLQRSLLLYDESRIVYEKRLSESRRMVLSAFALGLVSGTVIGFLVGLAFSMAQHR